MSLKRENERYLLPKMSDPADSHVIKLSELPFDDSSNGTATKETKREETC
jgi:hypothetical protein